VGSFTPASSTVAALGTGSLDYATGSFELETLSSGDLMNNSGSIGASGSLISGSGDNVRWEIANSDTSSGQFSLLIRRGDDNQLSKTVLETWNNLSLDPNSANYIEQVIGNQSPEFKVDTDGVPYIENTGSFANNSRYVRVKGVTSPLYNYFDNNGDPKTEYVEYMPKVGSGSVNTPLLQGAFTGGTGGVFVLVLVDNN
jgi:hypothetical protein